MDSDYVAVTCDTCKNDALVERKYPYRLYCSTWGCPRDSAAADSDLNNPTLTEEQQTETMTEALEEEIGCLKSQIQDLEEKLKKKVTDEGNQLMESAKNVKELKEQINNVITMNLNLSATLAKQSEQKPVDEKTEELSPSKDDEPIMVPCDICGVKAAIPQGQFMTHCHESSCLDSVHAILAPVPEGCRVARVLCKNINYFTLKPLSQKTVNCKCCQREYIITDSVTEIRNNQIVYKAEIRDLPEDEIIQLKKKIEQLEEENSRCARELKLLHESHGKMDKVNADLQQKNDQLVEMNMMLIKKIMNQKKGEK